MEEFNKRYGLHHVHLEETDSTNSVLREHIPNMGNERYTLVSTEYQTAGRGQKGNTWESERNANLLFSLGVHTTSVPVTEQFVICELISITLCEALWKYSTEIRIKWPNDIYWRNKKICGILIEHDLSGANLSYSIIGVGLNVNQEKFLSPAPNPVSLLNITGHTIPRDALLKDICERFILHYDMYEKSKNREAIHHKYLSMLYRKDVPAQYKDANGIFTATLIDVKPDGVLILQDEEGKKREYLFKEIAFVIK